MKSKPHHRLSIPTLAIAAALLSSCMQGGIWSPSGNGGGFPKKGPGPVGGNPQAGFYVIVLRNIAYPYPTQVYFSGRIVASFGAGGDPGIRKQVRVPGPGTYQVNYVNKIGHVAVDVVAERR